jgi:hypothetical protein
MLSFSLNNTNWRLVSSSQLPSSQLPSSPLQPAGPTNKASKPHPLSNLPVFKVTRTTTTVALMGTQSSETIEVIFSRTWPDGGIDEAESRTGGSTGGADSIL